MSEPRKQRRSWRRTLQIGLVAVLVVLAAATVLRSYLLNRAFAADTKQRAQAAANTDWAEGIQAALEAR